MSPDELKKLSDQDLLELKKKTKSAQQITAVVMGVLIGVSVYSAVKNGLKFFTFFPLILVYVLGRGQKNSKEIDAEIKSRNIN